MRRNYRLHWKRLDDVSVSSTSGVAAKIVGPLTTAGTNVLDGLGRIVHFHGVDVDGLQYSNTANVTTSEVTVCLYPIPYLVSNMHGVVGTPPTHRGLTAREECTAMAVPKIPPPSPPAGARPATAPPAAL